MKDESKEPESKSGGKKPLFAKKDFVIHQNEYHFDIKKGDDLADIPKQFKQNLKTEGVI